MATKKFPEGSFTVFTFNVTLLSVNELAEAPVLKLCAQSPIELLNSYG